MANKKKRRRRQRERSRRQAPKKRRRRQVKKSPRTVSQKPWKPIKMDLYKAPQVFPEAMTREERIAQLRNVAKHAEDEFQRQYFKINEWFTEYDALYLLSYCSTYFLAHREGTDPEAHGSRQFYPHYLEILQAFSLMQQRFVSSRILGSEAAELLEHVKSIGEAMAIRGLEIKDDAAEDETKLHRVLLTIRSETASVRNWGYPSQMRNVTASIAEKVRNEFSDLYGVDPVRFVNAVFALGELAEDRLNQHLGRVRRFLRKHNYESVTAAFLESFPDALDLDLKQTFNVSGRNVRNFKSRLVAYTDQELVHYLTFSLDDIHAAYGDGGSRVALKRLFDDLTLEFGQLNDQNKEHVILDNPVWVKPFIKTSEETYFSAVVGLLPHYALYLLENLVSANHGVQEKYRQRKARYLEEELERLFKASFQDAKVYRGSLWRDPDGASRENDITVVVDCAAIVVEAKSGQISPSAKRGGTERLRRMVRELIDGPAKQAQGFIQVLKSLDSPYDFPTTRGTVNTMDVTGVRHFIPLTVTFDQFGSVSNLRDFGRGWHQQNAIV